MNDNQFEIGYYEAPATPYQVYHQAGIANTWAEVTTICETSGELVCRIYDMMGLIALWSKADGLTKIR